MDYFSSQVKAQAIMVGKSKQRQLKAGAHPAPTVRTERDGAATQVSFSHFTPNQGCSAAHSGWIFSSQLIITITHPQECPEAHLQMKLGSVNWQSTLIIPNGLLDLSFSKGSALETHH